MIFFNSVKLSYYAPINKCLKLKVNLTEGYLS